MPAHPSGNPIARTKLEASARLVAPRLLGCRLISLVDGEPTGGTIVEVEAYVGSHDPASHAAARIGRTARNSPMFGPAGTAYVYFIYGMHWCVNVVTSAPGDPEAVLIRAIAPEFGRDLMVRRRGRESNLTNGPARLCEALGIDGTLNGVALDRPPLLLLEGALPAEDEVRVSGRIGIREAADWPLRFFVEGHPCVSSSRPGPSKVTVTA